MGDIVSNDKLAASFHPDGEPERLVYKVELRVEPDGTVWYECPICGPLKGAVAHGHGPEHIVEDASA